MDQEVPDSGPPCPKQLVARYGQMGYLGVFGHDLDTAPIPNTALVLRTGRGAELGRALVNIAAETALFSITPDQLESFLQLSGPDYPVSRSGRVLRLATPQDLNDQAHLDKSVHEVFAHCRDEIRRYNLDMQLVSVEHLLGGERIVFYFTSEARIDFRDLVKGLATQYHTRIEMRQVGARDEARLVADYERCGRRCCCQEYLKLLKPVSMKMAKCQKATLDPTKISGRCGRLMCCLRHEDETYTILTKQLPRKGIWVKTADGVIGRVYDSQIMTQLVRIILPDGTPVVVPNEEIVERNIPEPPPQPIPERRSRPAKPQSERRPLWSAPAPASDAAQDAAATDSAQAVAAAEAGANALAGPSDDAAPPDLNAPVAVRADSDEADTGSESSDSATTAQQPSDRPGEQGEGQARRRHRRGRRGRRHPEALSAGPQVGQGDQGGQDRQPQPSQDNQEGSPLPDQAQGQGAPGQGQARRRRRRRRGGRRPDGQAGPRPEQGAGPEPTSPPPAAE